MTPSDVLLRQIQLEHANASVEDYKQFVEELMGIVDRTHSCVNALRRHQDMKKLGDFLWERIFVSEHKVPLAVNDYDDFDTTDIL